MIEDNSSAIEIARSAAAYIVHCQDADGFFQYEYNLASGKAQLGDGNVVRQCGTASSLAHYLLHFPEDTMVMACVDRALTALVKRSKKVGKGPRAIAFVCASASKKIPLGATALALLTELLFHVSSGSDKYAQYRKMWLHGIIANRILGRKNGFSKYAASVKRCESDYYNGECLYALAVYSSIFKQQHIAREVHQVRNSLIRKYKRSNFSIKFFHWGQLAVSVLSRSSDSPRNATALAAFVRDQISSALRHKPFNPTKNTCYFLEGLVAGHLVLAAEAQNTNDKDNLLLLSKLKTRIQQEKGKNARLQIPPNTSVLSLGHERYFYSPDLLELQGAFRNGLASLKSRIDTCQHCLSAFLPFVDGPF